MDRAPFSAFLLLLVGIVLLAQFVSGSLDEFIAGLLGQSPAPADPPPGTSGTSTKATPTTYAGSKRST